MLPGGPRQERTHSASASVAKLREGEKERLALNQTKHARKTLFQDKEKRPHFLSNLAC